MSTVKNAYGKPLTQAEYDKLVRLADRLLRLCQSRGLVDGERAPA